ncbi:hypothetical protein G7072_13875 [Nocardioides sp. HDW12B]|uniref:hypothetical protein n=1 Tax=Nocardioides sp. HDW12B TaxID=2714939 RepID=UPI00140B02DB|nr:hypothetical protein [Nocardioides sp. HDW12B]QIK67293.1 hypothetical protein G7072_13875 [Nocardioides sp. HDW12B]
MGDFRELSGVGETYWAINREERQYAAILYHLLLNGDNLPRFLELIDCPYKVDETWSAYVEYAYLRDAWDKIGNDNDKKRKLISALLNTHDVSSLESASVQEWNEHFGVGTPVASTAHVQSPSRWSLAKFDANVADNDDFLATCQFKWAFNIKPDIVIHTDNDHAVVIEAKCTAGEGSYPSTTPEKDIFKRRGLPYVRQTDVQQYLFKEILGIEAVFRYVVKAGTASTPSYQTVLWKDAFAALEHTGAPTFLTAWLRKLVHD